MSKKLDTQTYRGKDVTGALDFARELSADLWETIPDEDRPKTDREAASYFFKTDRSGANMDEFLELLRHRVVAKRVLRGSKRKPPKKAGLTNVAQLKAWIKNHVPPAQACSSNPGPAWRSEALDDEVLWWWACYDAGTYMDLRIKDIASILISGLPRLTLQDVQDGLDAWHEDYPDSAASDIENNLKTHFGLRL